MRDDIWIGKLDISVSEEGKKQAEILAEKFKGNFKIYSSPLKRALQTAGIIAGDRKIEIVKEFTAREHSKATGKTA